MASLKLELLRAARAALICGAVLTAVPAPAEPTDMAVKAAFLPRFAKYVSWPSNAAPRSGDPFMLCVIGNDPFGSMLDEAARSQTVDGRPVLVRRMDIPAHADACQIAFVEGGRAAQVIAAIGRKPVLTVTDSAGSGARGIIDFVVQGGRVRFLIDQTAASQRGIAISSRLLALAVGVRQ